MPQPNIIYINPDQMRADALACYGNSVIKTPNFDRLAAEGVRYDKCFVQHTVCTPSRCSFMTGWYPHVRGHRTLWHPLQNDEPNTLKYLKQSGYEVHWMGKNDLLAEDAYEDSVTAVYEWGWSKGAEQLFEYGEPGYFSFLLGPTEGDTMDSICFNRAVEFLKSRKDGDAPFMLYLPTVYPHCPFTCPEPWYSMYDPEDIPDFRPRDLENKPSFYSLIREYRDLDNMDPMVFKKIMAVYLGMISYQDHLLGQLLDAVDECGFRDNTAVFIFSDHGEWAGDFGLVEKWHAGLDDCLTHVPMIVRTPDCKAGHVVDEQIELFDIVPTTLELAGIDLQHTQFGVSMMDTLNGAAGDPKRAVFAEGGYDLHEPHCFEGQPDGYQDIGGNEKACYYPKGLQQQEQPHSSSRCTMIRTLTHKLVRRTNDTDELYDLVADPLELKNVYDDPHYTDIKLKLENQMLDWYIHTSDVVPFERQNRSFPQGLQIP